MIKLLKDFYIDPETVAVIKKGAQERFDGVACRTKWVGGTTIVLKNGKELFLLDENPKEIFEQLFKCAAPVS